MKILLKLFLSLLEWMVCLAFLPLFLMAFLGLRRNYRWAEIAMTICLSVKLIFYSPSAALGMLKGV